jgi:ABC-2 type transport system permease protein
MAVHKRSYRGYAGALTAAWSRCLIVTRYAFKNVFSSRLLTAFFVICFFYPLGCAIAIYVNSNLRMLSLFSIHSLIDVDGHFFFTFLNVQLAMAFILTAFVGPGLISPDLANNALPLYLCRPFLRAEYVVGKMAVLTTLISLITWVPGLFLFLVQSSLAGFAWTQANLWIAGAIFLGSLIQILVLCLLSMALSAWIKRKLAAGAALLGVFFFGAGLGAAINAVMSTRMGNLLNVGELLTSVEVNLFRVVETGRATHVPSDFAWLALLAMCAFCLMLIERKVRAYEVVKG